MKTLMLATAGAILLTGIGAASAQTVIITQEQQPVVKRYVLERKVRPWEIPPQYNLEIGAALPQDVELHRFDAPEMQTNYRYVVVDGRTVLVDPQTRHVVQIIE